MARKTSLKTAKARAWKAMSAYIRRKAADYSGHTKCVTCGEWRHYTDMDAGHFVSKNNGNAVYFEEENVHPQCQRCNRFLEGNGPAYTLFMIDTYGREKVEELQALARTKVRFRVQDYLEIEADFKQRLRDLAA